MVIIISNIVTSYKDMSVEIHVKHTTYLIDDECKTLFLFYNCNLFKLYPTNGEQRILDC